MSTAENNHSGVDQRLSPLRRLVVDGSKDSEQPKLSDLAEFRTLSDPNQIIAMRLLDRDAMANLSFDQKRGLLIFYIWQNNDSGTIGLNLPDRVHQNAISSGLEELEERYQRFIGVIELVKRARKTLRRPNLLPSINEFDQWVYQEWAISGKFQKDLVSQIPNEFGFDNLNSGQRLKLIKLSMEKLTDYNLVKGKVEVKRKNSRRMQLRTYIRNYGMLTRSEFAAKYNVSLTTIKKDLAALRREGQIHEGNKPRNHAERVEIAQKVRRFIAEAEKKGRNYRRGEITHGEIARAIGMEPPILRSLMYRFPDIFNLPQRENPSILNQSKRRLYRERVRTLMEQGLADTTSIYNALKNEYPDFTYSIRTIRGLRNEILSET